MLQNIHQLSIVALAFAFSAGCIISIKFHFKIEKSAQNFTDRFINLCLLAYLILIFMEPVKFELIVPKKFLTDNIISSRIFYNLMAGIISVMGASMITTQIIMLFTRKK